MVFQYILTIVVLLYMSCDVNYVVRTLFTVWCSRLWRKKDCCLSDVTSIYGLCTLQDCDVWFKNLRLARILRELDFARYHFYDHTRIYERSRALHIRSLQGSTLTITLSPIPLFALYKINTKLVYWDDRSLFLEHEVVTTRDGKTRCLLVSRQYALGVNKEATTDILLNGIPGSESRPVCPPYIKKWLESQRITSATLKNVID